MQSLKLVLLPFINDIIMIKQSYHNYYIKTVYNKDKINQIKTALIGGGFIVSKVSENYSISSKQIYGEITIKGVNNV